MSRNINNPAWLRDFSEPCEWCGARWDAPEDETPRAITHDKDCGYIIETTHRDDD